MEVELMVTKRDDDRQPTTDRVNIEQSASGRLEGRVLQKLRIWWRGAPLICLMKNFRTKFKEHFLEPSLLERLWMILMIGMFMRRANHYLSLLVSPLELCQTVSRFCFSRGTLQLSLCRKFYFQIL